MKGDMPRKELTDDVQVTGKSSGEFFKIDITGNMVYENSQDVKEAMLGLIQEEISGYIVDLTELDKIDSTGFGVLINFAKETGRRDAKICLLLKEGFIRKLCSISKFDSVFPIAETEEEALRYLRDKVTGEMPLNKY